MPSTTFPPIIKRDDSCSNVHVSKFVKFGSVLAGNSQFDSEWRVFPRLSRISALLGSNVSARLNLIDSEITVFIGIWSNYANRRCTHMIGHHTYQHCFCFLRWFKMSAVRMFDVTSLCIKSDDRRIFNHWPSASTIAISRSTLDATIPQLSCNLWISSVVSRSELIQSWCKCNRDERCNGQR